MSEVGDGSVGPGIKFGPVIGFSGWGSFTAAPDNSALSVILSSDGAEGVCTPAAVLEFGIAPNGGQPGTLRAHIRGALLIPEGEGAASFRGMIWASVEDSFQTAIIELKESGTIDVVFSYSVSGDRVRFVVGGTILGNRAGVFPTDARIVIDSIEFTPPFNTVTG